MIGCQHSLVQVLVRSLLYDLVYPTSGLREVPPRQTKDLVQRIQCMSTYFS